MIEKVTKTTLIRICMSPAKGGCGEAFGCKTLIRTEYTCPNTNALTYEQFDEVRECTCCHLAPTCKVMEDHSLNFTVGICANCIKRRTELIMKRQDKYDF